MITQEELRKVIDDLKLTFNTAISTISKVVSDKLDEIEYTNNKPVRFERREDCYHDHKTGLEWSLDNISKELTWHNALSACTTLGYGWRLPTIQELLTLVEYEKSKPAAMLPNMRSFYYWSATIYDCYADDAWVVDFSYGNGFWYYKFNDYYVRAVRTQTCKI